MYISWFFHIIRVYYILYSLFYAMYVYSILFLLLYVYITFSICYIIVFYIYNCFFLLVYISLYIDILERAGDRAEHGRARGGSNADARVYARAYLSMIMCGKYILWAFCGDKLLYAAVSIKCTMSIIQSFSVHAFPLFVVFLMCFTLAFLHWWYPLPIFQRAQPA